MRTQAAADGNHEDREHSWGESPLLTATGSGYWLQDHPQGDSTARADPASSEDSCDACSLHRHGIRAVLLVLGDDWCDKMYGCPAICLWPRISFEWNGLCSHNALLDNIQGDLELTQEQLEAGGDAPDEFDRLATHVMPHALRTWKDFISGAPRSRLKTAASIGLDAPTVFPLLPRVL